METNFNTKNYTLTPSETRILNKKINNIKHILKKSKGNPFLKIEIEELTKVDDSGNRYRCEANLTIYDKSIRTQVIKGTKKFKTTIIKNAVKNKYSFLNRILGRRSKKQDIYENIE
jgi:ribosome-associated translation inhibitor RaiA